MSNYYAEKLNSQSLFRVYDSAIPQVQQYLADEIDFVKNRLSATHEVVELAAGYGRIVKELAPFCHTITGVDISAESVELGRQYLAGAPNASMAVMDLFEMSFDRLFDVVLLLQNGLSAIRATEEVITKIMGLAAPGGTIYFSTYSPHFWEQRMLWFEEQAQKGLLGQLDYDRCADGVIVCKDGFRSTSQSAEDYRKIGEASGYPYEIQEVGDSSLFLIIHKS